MNKFILWLALLLGDGQVIFIRDYTAGAVYDSGVDDWHCSKCGGNLCTGCGYCTSCERCHCK